MKGGRPVPGMYFVGSWGQDQPGFGELRSFSEKKKVSKKCSISMSLVRTIYKIEP